MKDVLHKSSTVLLIMDMLNTFDFPKAELLLKRARPIAPRVARLKARAKKKKIPVIYANDNFGQWRSDWSQLYDACTLESCAGREIVEKLKPDPDDYFILKPKHSGFYSTPLDVLLKQMSARRLIITGIAADICVLFTVQDAHTLEYEVVVPSDCVAAETGPQERQTLALIRKAFKGKTPVSSSLRL